MGIRWRFRVDTLEVSGSFGSGPLSVIPFCHRIPITHGATSTTPSTREVAHERQEIDNTRELSRSVADPCCRCLQAGGENAADQVRERAGQRGVNAQLQRAATLVASSVSSPYKH